MTPEYEEKADAAERELADMEERADQLGDRIGEARDDWEAKKQDSKVPGAAGDPDQAEEGGQHPETAYPAKGPEDEVSEEDPTDNDRGVDDTPDDNPAAEDGGGEERASGVADAADETGESAGAGDESAGDEDEQRDEGAADEERDEGAAAG